MKKAVEKILKIITKAIIRKHKPDVIGITGSVGKTSTRDAIFCTLSSEFQARRSEKNYNNEIGLPLAVIGMQSPGKSVFGWLRVMIQGILIIMQSKDSFPKILILEMGADKPGDIAYLLDITKCDIGVITKIGESHLEAFGSLEKIKSEKSLLVKELKEGGWAVLNADDPAQASLARDFEGNLLTYGILESADVKALEIVFSFEHDYEEEPGKSRISKLAGISFKLKYKGSVVPVFLPEVIGYPVIYSALAAAACGIIKGMNLIQISQALLGFTPPKGRMNLIDGVKGTLIIDDTYNSSPQSSAEAIGIFDKIPKNNNSLKYAIFGDMLELGSYTVAGHEKVGRKAAQSDIDILVAVGEKARHIMHGASKSGMKQDRMFHFDDNIEAAKFVQERMRENDLLLIKGSQGARMEKAVKELMAEPVRAEELLVRQSKEWS